MAGYNVEGRHRHKHFFVSFMVIVFLLMQVVSLYADEFSFCVATYDSIEDAENEIARLTSLGYNAFFQKASDKSDTISYRVCIGKYPFRDQAVITANKMKNSGHIDTYQLVNLKNTANPENTSVLPEQKEASQHSGCFTIHVSSFRDERRAQSDVASFTKKNMTSFYLETHIPEKGKWYRVYVGQYETREEAVKEKNKLKHLSGKGIDGSVMLVNLKNTAKSQNTSVLPEQKETGRHSGYFTIHVSSFRDERRAQSDVASFTKKNMPSFYIETHIPEKGKWYRVYLGQYETREEAVKEKNKLQHLSGKGTGGSVIFLEKSPLETIPSEKMAATAPPQETLLSTHQPLDPESDLSGHDDTGGMHGESPEPNHESPNDMPPKRSEKTIALGNDPREPSVSAFPEESAPAPESISKPKRHFFQLKAGILVASDLSDLKINNDRTIMYVSGDTASLAAASFIYPVTSSIFLESGMEGGIEDGIKFWSLFLGPRMQIIPSGNWSLFLRTAIVFGGFDWKDAPGSFDTGTGWEISAGAEWKKFRTALGLEVSYRNIQYGYDLPDLGTVTANGDEIDLSGIITSFLVRF